MLKNGNKKCPLSHEIVSYMYGELGGGNELEFEKHLADCMACTDEFAAVSVARYSVFEWQKEEFAHLPTPEIVIPYASTIGAGEAVGIVAAVRAWVGSFGFPASAAAVIVLCIGLGLLALNMLGRRDQHVAGNVSATAVPQIAELPSIAVPDPNPTAPDEERRSIIAPVAVKRSVEQRRPARRSSPVVDRPANSYAVAPKQAAQTPKTPVLTPYDDSDDNSLRLADLFEEVGG